MKRLHSLIYLSSIIVISLLTQTTSAQVYINKVDNKEIHWITLQQMEQNMKTQPKKIIIDVYTQWCGWCKVMEKKTYSDTNVIQYINQHFYAVKLDAETKDDITFAGKNWEYLPQQKVNRVALELLNGRLSYPTTVIMSEDMKSANPIPGYLDVPTIEMILKFVGGDKDKTTTWAEWQKTFKPEWK